MTNRTAEVSRLSWAEVCARRLDRHALSSPSQDAWPAGIVGTMCGAHAQVLSAAELSIGLRIAGITRTDVQEALWTEHSLVKTFGPRGTVHLLSTQDLPMWTAALSAIPSSSGSQPENMRLTPRQTDEIVEGIADALDDAELTIDELNEAVIAATGPWPAELVVPAFAGMWPRCRLGLAPAGIGGALCFAPTGGRKVTSATSRGWLPGFRPADEQTALAESVRRYLYAYGPATPQQFAQWLGAPGRWATELFDSLSDELQHVEVDGALAWLATGDAMVPSTAPQGVRLLPYFDAYTVGCQPRELLFPGRAAERALTPSGQAGNFPVLLIGGSVAGGWPPGPAWPKIHTSEGPFDPHPAPQCPYDGRPGGGDRGFLSGTPQPSHRAPAARRPD